MIDPGDVKTLVESFPATYNRKNCILLPSRFRGVEAPERKLIVVSLQIFAAPERFCWQLVVRKPLRDTMPHSKLDLPNKQHMHLLLQIANHAPDVIAKPGDRFCVGLEKINGFSSSPPFQCAHCRVTEHDIR